MDDDKYVESIVVLAQSAARADVVFHLEGLRSVVGRLREGLTDGTADADKFDRAVTEEALIMAAQQPASEA
jgi:hypothetical protein